jgi:hypothetical protein
MKEVVKTPNWNRLNKTLLNAEHQFKQAQVQARQTEAKTRLAKHRHKQAKETARHAKKEAKRIKASFREAEAFLEQAGANLKRICKAIADAKKEHKGSRTANGSTLHLQPRKKSRTWKRAAAKSRKKPLGQEQIALAARPLIKTQMDAPAASTSPVNRESRPLGSATQ